MSLDYFQCQLFLKWRDKLHYQWPIFPAWLRTSEAFSIWTSVLSQLTFHRRRTSLSSVSCLAKKKKKKSLESKDETPVKALAQKGPAGLSLSGSRGRGFLVPSGVAGRSHLGGSLLPTPHSDAYTLAKPTACPSRWPSSHSHIPILVLAVPQNPVNYLTSRALAPALSWGTHDLCPLRPQNQVRAPEERGKPDAE